VRPRRRYRPSGRSPPAASGCGKWEDRQGREAQRYRDALVARYGAERGQAIRFAEAFELCEYGHRPTAEELRALFPF